MSNNIFIEEFNIIFNKIPHIYSELFQKIFKNNYYYFLDYNKLNNLNLFIEVLKDTFNNLNNLNKEYYYNYILKYIFNNNLSSSPSIIYSVSKKLSSPIEDNYLLDIIDKNYTIKINHNTIPKHLAKLYIYLLISKTLLKTITVLTNYSNTNNIEFKKNINIIVEKYRNLELNMDYVLEDYSENYNLLITKTNFKILIYLLSLSKNGKEIERKYQTNISKLLDSLGYDTNMHKIINYHRINYNIKPYIYINITKLINTLFYKYHDNYKFISDKELILKTSFYLYIRKLSLKDKIIISITYFLWEYEWDSIKEIYENYHS